MSKNSVICQTEKKVIPTYVPPVPEEMPMYSEFRQHQGSTGYAYPNKVTIGVEQNKITDVEYDMVRLENDYIRLMIIPALGGKILEGYDKTTDYHFVYSPTRIKPVTVASYGSFIGGGVEFNFPYHHRPSTFMPVDYTIEECEDGSKIVWCSEAMSSPGQYRLKGTCGIKLRPDTSYFETIVKIDNRTPVKHPFLWWENCGVHVNQDYQLLFPQDVGYVHHHYDRHHASFPIQKGLYAVEVHEEETDISMHKNVKKGNSLFAAPSKYDWFGGYDHGKDCGTIHVANHHITPGKKMFEWGFEELSDAWNGNITDADGEHGELMAGSFSDDQPDFTYIAPYECKYFSQFWYPVHGSNVPVFANLNGIISLDKKAGSVRVSVTSEISNAVFELTANGETVLKEVICNLKPSEYKEFVLDLPEEKYSMTLTAEDGTELMDYTEDKPEVLDIPKDNPGIPTPHQLESAQDITLAGLHIEQYRDPAWRGIDYFEVALERDPKYIPALLAMAEDRYNHALYEEGLSYLKRAEAEINKFNKNPYDGTYSYFKGLCEYGLEQYDKAYDAFYKASWSNNVATGALTFLAAIDGKRGDFKLMKQHSVLGCMKEKEHAILQTYTAIAECKLGNKEKAVELLKDVISRDKLDHLARFVLALYTDTVDSYYTLLNSNPSQTCLDVAFNLLDAGLKEEAAIILEGLKKTDGMSTMTYYVLADIYTQMGETEKAKVNRAAAYDKPYVDVFPYRMEEIEVLKRAVETDSDDYTAVYLYGCILYDKTHYEDAAECFRKTIKLKNDFYIPYRNLAIAYYSKLNRKEEALELMKKACQVKPNDDTLVKETNYVMCKMGVNGTERLNFVLENMPKENPTDNITWDLADTYNNVFEFDKALETLANHEFVAAECQETYLTEAYTFALCCKGRLLREEGKLEDALECFKKSQVIPANFRAGWWDLQALYYARYFEAETLKMLGKDDEAKKVVGQLVPFIHSAYSPYMGPETDYYVALAYRMLGDNVISQREMSRCIKEWEAESVNDLDRTPIVTSLYWSFVPDGVTEYKAEVVRALAYSRLFFNDKEGAKELFKKSLELNPDNLKAKFELYMLGK